MSENPFVFACVNGFLCEDGSDQVAREISLATFDFPDSSPNTTQFHCETCVLNVFDEHDHLLYHFGASDQIRNIHHSHHSGFPRPVHDETEFAKYYGSIDTDNRDLVPLATSRGDCTLTEAQSKMNAFLRPLALNPYTLKRADKIYIGVIRAFEYPFFQKFFAHTLFLDFNIEFVVYDRDTLAPFSVYSYEYPPNLFPPGHERHHRNFEGYPYPSKHGCTITRAWYYLQKRNDPLYTKIQKDRYENRIRNEGTLRPSGNTTDTGDENPIDLHTIHLLLDIHKYTKGYRFDGWCRPLSVKSKQESGEDENEGEVVKYNTYCQYYIVP